MTDKSNATGGDTAREFDLAELLNGSVDSISEKFGELSDDQLAQLHTLEGKGGKRVTLLDAIHREQARRAGEGAGERGDGADDQGGEHDDADDEPETFTQAQVDQLLAERDAKHAAELKAAKAGAKGGAKPVADPKAKKIELDAKSDAPNLIALTGPSKIVFVDAEDMTLPKLPEMTFDPADFDAVGDGVKLKKMIDFPAGLVGSEVSGAFLFGEDGKAAGKATLVLPFQVGGGKNARMAPGTLVFERSPIGKAA